MKYGEWRTPVDGEDGGVSLNAISLPDGRREESQDERRDEGGLISVLDGTALNWCRQEELRARMIK